MVVSVHCACPNRDDPRAAQSSLEEVFLRIALESGDPTAMANAH